jgi:signal transduction histidine kinase/DNA-binding response OmpR family regulator/HPt (histidine-containing phosphotransfer) domain-containing protein
VKALSIRNKLFLATASVALCFVVAVVGSMSRFLETLVRNEVEASLRSGHRSAERFLQLREELLRQRARSMANTPFLIATMTIPDVDPGTGRYAVEQLSEIRGAPERDLVVLLDRAGRTLVGPSRDAPIEETGAGDGVARALEGREFIGITGYEDQHYLVSATPILSGGEVVGALMLGERLDDAFAGDVRGFSGRSTMFVHRGKAIARSIEGSRFASTRPETDLATILREPDGPGGRDGFRKVTVDGRRSLALSVSIPGSEYRVVMFRPLDGVDSGLDALRVAIIWAGIASGLLALVLSFWVSSRVSRPIRKLRDTVVSFGPGKLDVRAEVESGDELGELGHAFNDMAERLGDALRSTRILSGTNTELQEEIERHRKTQAELEKAKRAAEEASRAKSLFLANMSHEIRTPMNGVFGMTELLLGTRLDDRQRRFAETARRSGEALLTVINDILDLSKIEAGKLELETLDFDVWEVVGDLGELFAERAHQKGLELACHVLPDVPRELRGDPNRLRQVLTNLIGNAIKFTNSGEVVMRVEVLRRVGDEIVLRFEVKDTGIGMTADETDRIFDAFAQADQSTTRRFGGTGLGLTISRQLVEAMGGRIEVRSEPGKGSVFSFAASFRAGLGTGEDSIDELRGVRLLVLDDNATNRAILKEQADGWGISCTCASTGQEALEQLAAAARRGVPFDLAIVDLDLPEMDGLEVTRRIRESNAFGDISVIMLASIGALDIARDADRLRIARHLSKPVRAPQLYRCIGEVLGRTARTPTEARSGAATRPRRFRGRVLLCEDSRVNQDVATGMLEAMGLDVDVANNGREALAAFGRRRYDVILMDVQMPEIDGHEATRRIRRQEGGGGPEARRTPIVALTANATESDRRTCLACGMDDYVSKPFTEKELHATLGRWLPAADEGEPSSAPGALTSHRSPPAPRPAETSAERPARGPIDSEALERIRKIGSTGSRDLLERVLRAFLDESRQLVDALAPCLAEARLEDAARVAHRFKSMAAHVGALRVEAASRDLEAAAKEKNAGAANAAFEALRRELSAATDIFRSMLDSASGRPNEADRKAA